MLDGSIPAGPGIVAACERAVADHAEPPELPVGRARFSEERVAHVLDFFSRFLRHAEGKHAGRPFEPAPWQAFVLSELFGWIRPDEEEPTRWVRRYRIGYLEVPRKNGKTTFAAGVSLYMLAADDEPAAEVYCAATKREQARIVFTKSCHMVQQLPEEMRRPFQEYAAHLTYGRSVMRFVTSEARTLDGLNPHCAIIDELHAHADRDVWDRIVTGIGSRTQPLVLGITTAGDDHDSIAGQLHAHARSVLSGATADPAFFTFVANLDDGDDWRDPDVWGKVNPNLGVSVDLESLRQDAARAEGSTRAEGSFRRFRLNEWIAPLDAQWLTYDLWNACAGPQSWQELRESIRGREVYGGLDLASTQDLTAFVLIAPPDVDHERWVVVPFFWIPAERIAQRVQVDRVPYDVWNDNGLLEATPGDAIDDRTIVNRVIDLTSETRCVSIGFDQWGAVRVASDLADAGLNLVRYAQGIRQLSPPTKRLEQLVCRREIEHGGHDVLSWNATNVVLRTDDAENCRPDKKKSREKIDGIVATILALDQAERTDEEPASVYSRRGLTLL